MPCTCGNPETHVMKRGRTADGMRIVLWDDGLITTALGGLLPKVGVARSTAGMEADLWAGWAVMGELSLLEFSELPRAVRAARALARKALDKPLVAADWRRALTMAEGVIPGL